MEIMVDIKDEGLVLNVSIAASGPPGPPGEGVPEYSEADNGKYLRVMDGAPQWAEGSGGGGGDFPYVLGPTLKVIDNTLDVNTADDVQQDNTLPITSAAVYATVGNIEILLGTI